MWKAIQRGYAALFAVIAAALVGMVIITSVSAIALSTNAAAATLQQSQQARSLANACAELALQKMLASAIFVGTANISIGTGSCTYSVTQLNALTTAIASTATVGTVVRKVKITVAISSVMPVLQVMAWQEVADF